MLVPIDRRHHTLKKKCSPTRSEFQNVSYREDGSYLGDIVDAIRIGEVLPLRFRLGWYAVCGFWAKLTLSCRRDLVKIPQTMTLSTAKYIFESFPEFIDSMTGGFYYNTSVIASGFNSKTLIWREVTWTVETPFSSLFCEYGEFFFMLCIPRTLFSYPRLRVPFFARSPPPPMRPVFVLEFVHTADLC